MAKDNGEKGRSESLTYDSVIRMLGEESGKCISCGFCDSACPTYPSSGYDPVITARGRAQLGKRLYDDITSRGQSELSVSDPFYSCLDCHACVEVCPTGVDAGKVSDLGKMVIVSGKGIRNSQEKMEAKMIVSATMKYNNPLGVREKCAEWADDLKFESGTDTLLYTGNMYQLMAYSASMRHKRQRAGKTFTRMASRIASSSPWILRAGSRSYDPDVMNTMSRNLRNIVELLRKSGVKFGYLREEEPYPGTFIHDLGYFREFREYANRVTDIFRKGGYRKIITLDPHTFELLRDVYPKYVDHFDFEVVYYLDLLDTGILKRTGDHIVFHEPCHLVLSKNSYNTPKAILSEISNLKLPERSGKRTFCCGGPSELLFSGLTDTISSIRFNQLKETGGDRIVTSCPICFVNLSRDGSVHDISDILAESVA